MSHLRIKRKPRCPGCGLRPDTCVCARLPRVRFETPIVLVQHVREKFKPTNTGKLLARLAEGTTLISCGIREPAFDPVFLKDPAVDWRLIFPREGAPVLDRTMRPAPGRRFGFVFLDGSWRSCSHMSRRLAGVSELPCLALPTGLPSFWTVRTQHAEAGRSTFEAVLDALQIVEGGPSIARLREAFALVTAGQLFLKGKLKSPEVPTSWQL